MLNQPKILVCTDFSSCSGFALRAAKSIGDRTKGKISVLNVIDHPTLDNWKAYESLTYSVGEALKNELLAHANSSMKQQLKECETEALSEVTFGSPKTVIMDKIKKDHTDLLIMGYRGKNPANPQLGNLTAKIIADSPIPVLVIKNRFDLNKLAGLVDPNGEKKEIISWAEELTYFFSNTITIISLFADHLGRFIGENKSQGEIFTDLLALSQEVKKETVHKIDKEIHSYINRFPGAQVIIRSNVETNIAQHLNAILTEKEIDTIVMQKHSASMFEKVLIGSETRNMLDLFNGNLLILS
jgi:nucleotide-binding universal stress UspA family protein